MSLLEDVKIVCRVSSSVFDTELEALISAALADMERVGIRKSLINEETINPLVRVAVFSYVKAHFGYDVSERAEFDKSYRLAVTDLLNSDANIASKADTDGEV